MSPKSAAVPKFSKAASASETAAIRAAHLMPLPGPMYAKPIQIVSGKMQFLYDENGKEYLDGFAGVATVSIGHSHPHFVAKLKAQIDQLQHNPPLYLHPSVGAFAKRLADKAKSVNPDMDVCFFTNSGSEANEMAAFVAKTYTTRHEFVAVQRSYHGRTLFTTALTGQQHSMEKWRPLGGMGHSNENTKKEILSRDSGSQSSKSRTEIRVILLPEVK